MLKVVIFFVITCLLLPRDASGQNDQVCFPIKPQGTTFTLSQCAGESGGKYSNCTSTKEVKRLERKIQSYRGIFDFVLL